MRLVARQGQDGMQPERMYAMVEQYQTGIADELRALSKLRDEGILTEAEFEARKTRLPGSPPRPRCSTSRCGASPR